MTEIYTHKISPNSRLSLLEDKGYELLNAIASNWAPGSILQISSKTHKSDHIIDPQYTTRYEALCLDNTSKTDSILSINKSFQCLIRMKLLLSKSFRSCTPDYLAALHPFTDYILRRANSIVEAPGFNFHCPTCSSIIHSLLSPLSSSVLPETLNHCDLHSSNFIAAPSSDPARSGWIDLENICLAPYFTDFFIYFFEFKNSHIMLSANISPLIEDAGRQPSKDDLIVAAAHTLVHREILQSISQPDASAIEQNFHITTQSMTNILSWKQAFKVY